MVRVEIPVTPSLIPPKAVNLFCKTWIPDFIRHPFGGHVRNDGCEVLPMASRVPVVNA
jgi:hypothetical protein